MVINIQPLSFVLYVNIWLWVLSARDMVILKAVTAIVADGMSSVVANVLEHLC